MKDLKHPAKSLYQNELNLKDGIIASKEDYHTPQQEKSRPGAGRDICYAGNLFGSVPWANRYILASSENFVELLVELFWSVQVVLKKTLMKSHDYSRLFPKETRRLKTNENIIKAGNCFMKVLKTF